jgi:hypothetical protein
VVVGLFEGKTMEIVGKKLLPFIVPFTAFPFGTCDVKKTERPAVNSDTLGPILAEGT